MRKTDKKLVYAFLLYQALLVLGCDLHKWPGLLAMPFVLLLFISVFNERYHCLSLLLNKTSFLALLCIQSVTWISIIILDYFSVSYNIFDTGIYAHVVFNLSSGRGLYNHILQRPTLSDHFTPNLVLLVPLFWMYISALWLPLARLACYLSCLPVLWSISGHYLENPRSRYFILLLWLINYPLVKVLDFEFHPSSLALPFILLSFYFWLRKRPLLSVLSLLFILGFKEHLALAWVSVGIWLFFFEGRKKTGILLTASGIVAGLVIIYLAIPLLSQGVPFRQVSKFGLLAQPFGKLKFVFFILLSVGLLPLLKPRTLLFIIPSMGVSLVSNVEEMVTLNFQYQDLPVTITFVGTIIALSSWEKQEGWLFRASPLCRKVLVLAGVLGLTLFNNFYPGRAVRETFPTRQDLETIREIRTVRESLDKNKTLWCIDSLGVYFVEFPKLRSIAAIDEPFRENADYVVTADNVNLWPIERQYGPFKDRLLEQVTGNKYRKISGGKYLEVYEKAAAPE